MIKNSIKIDFFITWNDIGQQTARKKPEVKLFSLLKPSPLIRLST